MDRQLRYRGIQHSLARWNLRKDGVMPDFRSALQLNRIPAKGLVPETTVDGLPPASPADGQLWNAPANATPWNDSTTSSLLMVWSAGANSGTGAWVPAELIAGVIFDAMVNSDAQIAETKVKFTTDDSTDGTAARRKLGNGAGQAMAGDFTLNDVAAANAWPAPL